ncbi:MAG: tetratricopeptide repeat protein [Bacteroidota bacterium]
MRLTLFFTILLYLIVNSFTVFSQNSKLDCRLAEIYTQQKTEDYGLYITVIDTLLGRNYKPELHFKKMIVRHLYIAHLLFYDNTNKEIAQQIQAFKQDIRTLEKLPQYKNSMTAFYATYYGYYAAQRPSMALFYLPRSFSLAKEAIKTNSTSPYSWTEYGNLHYCYALFLHSDFSTAITAFTKAVKLFESEKLDLSCNWYYINSLLFLAKSYEDNKQFAEANKVYDKILNIRPDFSAITRWKHKL